MRQVKVLINTQKILAENWDFDEFYTIDSSDPENLYKCVKAELLKWKSLAGFHEGPTPNEQIFLQL